jgi:alpha-ketoglutarate-dependent taurine dioxygenase
VTEIRTLVEGVGAEVIGLDPEREFDDETRRTLRKAFDDHGALLFRNLSIDREHQDRLCRMLIGDDGPSTYGDRPVQLVSNKEDDGAAPYGRLLFHADMMWAEEPLQILSLYALNVEPGSATTSVASGVYACEHLPEELRARAENLHVVQMSGQAYNRGGSDLIAPKREHERSFVTPIIRRHQRTGKPVLFVSQQNTREIVEMAGEEGEQVLQTLFSEFYAPEHVYEHEWRDGDLLVIDNLAVQHARGNVELNGPTRTLRKVIAPIPKQKFERPTFDLAGRDGSSTIGDDGVKFS